MERISTGTIARTIVLGIALLNQVLTMTGHNPLPWSSEELYQGITGILTVGAALWSWWKNNSFTKQAMQADRYLAELKAAQTKED